MGFRVSGPFGVLLLGPPPANVFVVGEFVGPTSWGEAT